MNSPFRTKSVEQSIRDTEEPEHALRKSLSAWDLTVFGVGVIIGTGIFVLTGIAARNNAGPATALAFVAAGIVCALAALCYAEFASTVPVAGSAYTFSYASIGELPAWIIGWDLVLEFALGTAVVAVGWSGYVRHLMDTNLGWDLPTALSGPDAGGTFDLLAFLLILALTAILVVGTKLSARITAIVVAIKVTVVLLVIVAGLFFIKADNYSPFIPPAQPQEAETACTRHWSSCSSATRPPTSASWASSPRPPSSSSPSSASTSWPRRQRRPRTPSGTCREASSAR